MAIRFLDFGYMKYLLPVLGIAIGLHVAVTALAYVLKQRSLYIVSSTFAFFFTILFLTDKYSGYLLTTTYILLSQVLLLAGIFLKEPYWRKLSVVSLFPILFKLFLIDAFFVSPSAFTGTVNTRALLFGFAFLVYMANYILYTRLKKNQMLIKGEESYPLIMSYVYPLIFMMGTWLDLPKVLIAPSWVVLGVILLQLGLSRDEYHERVQGYFITMAAFAKLLMSNMVLEGSVSVFSHRVLTVVPVLLVLYYCLTILQGKKADSVLRASEKKMPTIYAYVIFAGLMFLIKYELAPIYVAPVWGVVVWAYAAWAIQSKKKYYFSICSIAALLATARAMFVNIATPGYLVGYEANILYPALTICVIYIGSTLFVMSKERLKGIEGAGSNMIMRVFRSPRITLGVTATVLLTALLVDELDGVSLTIGMGIQGLLLLLSGLGIKERSWRVYGLIVLLLTLLKTFLVDLRNLGTLYYILSLIVLGLALLFVSFIYTKHSDKIKKLI